MTTPNRMESHWHQLKPMILKRWDRLTESDVDYIDGEFDRLVDLVKQRYDVPLKTISEENIRFDALKMLKELEG